MLEGTDVTLDSSTNTGEDFDSSAEDSVNNDEGSQVEKLKRQVENLNEALRKERETKRGEKVEALSSVHESKEQPKQEFDFDKLYNERRALELEQDRKEFELSARDSLIKQYPSLADENKYGMKKEVVDTYNDLLLGRIQRGAIPKTQRAVTDLLKKAVAAHYPEVATKKQSSEDYGGMGTASGVPKSMADVTEEDVRPKSKTDKAFDAFMQNTIQSAKQKQEILDSLQLKKK